MHALFILAAGTVGKVATEKQSVRYEPYVQPMPAKLGCT